MGAALLAIGENSVPYLKVVLEGVLLADEVNPWP